MKLLIVTQKVDENDQLLGFFIGWLERFAKKFEKVTILCLEKDKYDLPSNTRVISLGKDRGSSKVVQLINLYKYLVLLRKDYDAVFVHMNPIWMVLGGLYWKMLNKKAILWYTHKAVTLKLRLAEKLSDIVLTASTESFRLFSSKVIVTGHGIDIELFRPNSKSIVQNSNILKILSVGRIAPVKNYETLVEAAKIIKQTGIDFVVTMIGEAALNKDKLYQHNLKLMIKNLELDENFHFVGKIDYRELPEYYQYHDIFVHLSKTGSLDKTLLEAMACGMNVLSSNDSARAFLSSNILFQEDDPKELAERIVQFSTMRASTNLREYVVDNHNLDKLINKITKIING